VLNAMIRLRRFRYSYRAITGALSQKGHKSPSGPQERMGLAWWKDLMGQSIVSLHH